MKNDFYCDEIFSGNTRVRRIKETPGVLAFYHTRPSYELHVVIVPKVHIVDLSELKDPQLLTEVFEVIQETVKILGLKTYRLISNSGDYQDSKHLHFHIVSGDKLEVSKV